MRMITMALFFKLEVTEAIKIVQMELIINNTLFSSNFCVDYDGYDIFELWNLSGKVYLL